MELTRKMASMIAFLDGPISRDLSIWLNHFHLMRTSEVQHRNTLIDLQPLEFQTSAVLTQMQVMLKSDSQTVERTWLC